MSNQTKTESEMSHWIRCFEREGGRLQNAHYEGLMTAVTGKPKDWFSGKVICDFGSGPRGSLEWANDAKERYCADVLIEEYRQLGIDNHKATYIQTSETNIPLPSGHCDVTLTINSIDHVDDLEGMCEELFRITKPGGYIGGSVNLNEPWTPAEPNTITEEQFNALVTDKLELDQYIVSPPKENRVKGESNYQYLFDHVQKGTPLPPLPDGDVGYLWFLGRVR